MLAECWVGIGWVLDGCWVSVAYSSGGWWPYYVNRATDSAN